VAEGLQSLRVWGACIAVHALRMPAVCPRCGRISFESPKGGTIDWHRCPHCGRVWTSTPPPSRAEPDDGSGNGS
jgi:transposase-like protein